MSRSSTFSMLAIPVAVLAGQLAVAQVNPTDNGSNATHSTTAPDNTKSNREDPSNMTHTAGSQSNNAADTDITRRIRSSVTADKNLSTYGHNVKIVTANGTVTLNGVVRSEDEKTEIGAKAAAVAGKDHVVNDLKVTVNK